MDIIDSVFRSAGVHIDNWTELTKLFSERILRPRESIVSYGQSWQELYYLRKGLIRLFYRDAEGNEFNKSFFCEGHCLWPVAPRDRYEGVLFNIATIEATQIVVCNIDALQQLLLSHGQWQTFSLNYAEQLLERKFKREHDLLTLKAKERYRNLLTEMPALHARIPDYHLASYLGVTNVSLSRLKRNF